MDKPWLIVSPPLPTIPLGSLMISWVVMAGKCRERGLKLHCAIYHKLEKNWINKIRPTYNCEFYKCAFFIISCTYHYIFKAQVKYYLFAYFQRTIKCQGTLLVQNIQQKIGHNWSISSQYFFPFICISLMALTTFLSIVNILSF